MQISTIDWDNVRLFLELTRRGSARSAAQALGISHSTVVRRVEQRLSSGRRAVAREVTVEEPCAQIRFEPLDPPHHRRMANAQCLRRAAGRAAAGEFEEQPYIVPVDGRYLHQCVSYFGLV